MSDLMIGIDLGGTSAKIGFVDEEGKILSQWKVPVQLDNGGVAIIPDIIESIKDQASQNDFQLSDFKGVGFAAPGSYDNEKGTLKGAFNLNWEHPLEIKKPLEEALGLPVVMNNDANVAALGEQWVGGGRGMDSLVLVTLGTGIGGGVIIDGKIHEGHAHSAGEIGHIRVQPLDGPQCTCGGIGCVEAIASGENSQKTAKALVKVYEGESAFKSAIAAGQVEPTSEKIFEEADKGDPFALYVLDYLTDYLALMLGHIGNTLNPESFVIGGGVSAAGDSLIQPLKEKFPRFTYPNVGETTDIRLAELGNDAGLIGAARLVQQL